ncbi:hypothetical protein [Oceanithermus sp.]
MKSIQEIPTKQSLKQTPSLSLPLRVFAAGIIPQAGHFAWLEWRRRRLRIMLTVSCVVPERKARLAGMAKK